MEEFFWNFFQNFKERKKWWLIPVIVIILSSGSAITPFIYTLF